MRKVPIFLSYTRKIKIIFRAVFKKKNLAKFVREKNFNEQNFTYEYRKYYVKKLNILVSFIHSHHSMRIIFEWHVHTYILI
jgi:hypothetical protein